ncbi:hypothetical protein B0H21DRAFT_704133 [Amylocystis lapponica]|nr:hypothetical protein B0H21DRAFT_704133 [Amylocystis lapponica]
MSAARVTGALLRSRQATAPLLQRRFASSQGHNEHHHEEHVQDITSYPKEDFSSPVWRSFLLLGIATAAFYKYAPAPGEDTFVTSFIAHYITPSEVWSKIAYKHLLMSVEDSDENLLMADAKLPAVHRYRYPQRFEQSSPHLQPVGLGVDLSDIVIKGDKV